MTNLAQLELPFGSSLPDLFCPACGMHLFGKRILKKKCAHVVFSLASAVPGFEYVAEKYRDLAEQVETLHEGNYSSMARYFMKRLAGKSVLAMGLTAGGTENGPEWNTQIVAIDFEGEAPPESTALRKQ